MFMFYLSYMSLYKLEGIYGVYMPSNFKCYAPTGSVTVMSESRATEATKYRGAFTEAD